MPRVGPNRNAGCNRAKALRWGTLLVMVMVPCWLIYGRTWLSVPQKNLRDTKPAYLAPAGDPRVPPELSIPSLGETRSAVQPPPPPPPARSAGDQAPEDDEMGVPQEAEFVASSNNDAGRHISGSGDSWASSQLDSMRAEYERILQPYPKHIQDMVKAMPARRFKEIRRARLHYDGQAPVTAKENTGRSGFTLSTRYGANSATAANVCVDRGSRKLYVYRGNGGNIISDTDKKLMTSVGHAGFKWTWKVEEKSGSPPSKSGSNAKWYPGMTVLASPAFDRHTTHFSEAVTFLFHAALHSEMYPWWSETKRVIHVKVKSSDFPWSKDFMRVCMAGLPDAKNVDLIWADQIQGPALHCFERAGLMAQQTHEYGYHADPWEAQLFREAAFKLFKVPEPPVLGVNQKVRTTVVGRKGRKKMVNAKEVVDVIKQTELAKFDYLPKTKNQPVFFEKDTSFKDQITIMRHTDVLVGLHGSGLNNAMFMEPGSVVIAIMPSNYIEYEWHNFITGSGSTYLIQPNTDVGKHSANCKKFPPECASLRPFQAKQSKCTPMWYCDAKVDLGATEVLFRSTSFLIRNMKREMAKSGHNMKFNGGRNPKGTVTQLDD